MQAGKLGYPGYPGYPASGSPPDVSLLNAFTGLGAGLSTFASNAARDIATTTPLLSSEPPAPDAAATATPPPAAPAQPVPRMPAGVNPYGDDPHAQALWLAEKAIMGPESGGKANAQNPVSSAGGLFQIINPTWDAAIRKMGLPVAQSDAERNQQKYLPDLNTAVMRTINTDAAKALDSQGLPVTVQTLQAAHRLGPGGAAQAIRAAMSDPDAPLVGNGLSADATKGNGDIARLTVGQFLAAPYPRAGNN